MGGWGGPRVEERPNFSSKQQHCYHFRHLSTAWPFDSGDHPFRNLVLSKYRLDLLGATAIHCLTQDRPELRDLDRDG